MKHDYLLFGAKNLKTNQNHRGPKIHGGFSNIQIQKKQLNTENNFKILIKITNKSLKNFFFSFLELFTYFCSRKKEENDIVAIDTLPGV